MEEKTISKNFKHYTWPPKSSREKLILSVTISKMTSLTKGVTQR